MHLEVRHLRLIQAIDECKTITKAADKLNLTQSALSHQLHDIEEKLGIALFLRVNKRLVFSPAGERVLSSARVVLDELDRAEDDIRAIAGGTKGMLRLATECYTCYRWLPPLLKKFRRKYPDIRLQVNVRDTRRPVGGLLDGSLDLAIISSDAVTSRVEIHELFEDEMVLVVAPDHPLAGKQFIRPRDLEGEHLFLYCDPSESFAYEGFLRPAGVTPAQVSEVQLTEAIVELVRANIGVSILSAWSVRDEINRGMLRAIPLTNSGFRRQWHAAVRREGRTPAYILDFIELLKADAAPVRAAPRLIDKIRSA